MTICIKNDSFMFFVATIAATVFLPTNRKLAVDALVQEK